MRADAQANQQAILEATWGLLTERGDDASMRQIASRAGVGIGTLYRHFPDRDALLNELFSYAGQRVRDIVRQYQEPWDNGEAEQKWTGFIREIADLKLGYLAQIAFPGAESSELVQRRVIEFRREMQAVLDQAKRWGLVDPSVSVERFHFGLASAMRPPVGPFATMTDDDKEWLIETYKRGLKPVN